MRARAVGALTSITWIALSISVPSAGAGAPIPEGCVYDADTTTLTLTLGGSEAYLEVRADGSIRVGSPNALDCSPATITNTTLIRVQDAGDGDREGIGIHNNGPGGPFPESIRFEIDLGRCCGDQVAFLGTDGHDRYAAGYDGDSRTDPGLRRRTWSDADPTPLAGFSAGGMSKRASVALLETHLLRSRDRLQVHRLQIWRPGRVRDEAFARTWPVLDRPSDAFVGHE